MELRGIQRLLGASLCGLVAFVAEPSAAAVPWSVYDFNYLSYGELRGQDNWLGSAPVMFDSPVPIWVYYQPQGGAPHPGSGRCVSTYGSPAAPVAYRSNDAQWSFDLMQYKYGPFPFVGETFAMGASMSIDYSLSAYLGEGSYWIQNTSTTRKIGFGVHVEPWYYCLFIDDALGNRYHSYQMGTRPTARNQVWDFKLEVFAPDYSEGWGTLYAKQRDVHTSWQPTQLQNVCLYLDSAGADIWSADQMLIKVGTRLVAMDNLWVAPEPAALSILALGAVGMIRRRKRKIR